MPRKNYRKRYRKNYRRRYPKKRYNKRSRLNSVIVRGPAQQPDRLYVKLRYAQNVNLSDNSSSTVDQIFRANGCFDPDFSLGGLQPNGFDQWSALYTRYRVHASKIQVKLVTATADPQNSMYVTMIPSTSALPVGTSIEGLLGNSYCKWQLLGPETGNSVTSLSNYVKISAFLGKEGVKYDDVNQAEISANPVRQVYWQFRAQTADGVIGVPALNCMFIITYFVEFFARRELSRS